MTELNKTPIITNATMKCTFCNQGIAAGAETLLTVQDLTLFGQALGHPQSYVLHVGCGREFKSLRLKSGPNTIISTETATKEGRITTTERAEKHSQAEWNQIYDLIVLLKNRAGLQDLHWVKDPPDVELRFIDRIVGMEIRTISLRDKRENANVHKAHQEWNGKALERPTRLKWPKYRAGDIVEAIMFSISEKELHLPTWRKQYSERWLALYADLGIAGESIGSWNQGQEWGYGKEVDPIMAKVFGKILTEIERRLKADFEGVFLCGQGWACEISHTRRALGLAGISKQARKAATEAPDNWNDYEVTAAKVRTPLIVEGRMVRGGTHEWGEAYMNFPT
jgi:hypothetical protein